VKHENILRLARLAHSNVLLGGASALTLAKRVKAVTGSTEAEEIVSQVYSASSRHSPVVECRECGQEHFGNQAAADCCRETLEY
jgi:hypothetical protein